MGFTFTNIQLRRSGEFGKAQADAIAEMIAAELGWKPVENPDEADVTTVVHCANDSEWIAIASDAFDSDFEAQLRTAKALSAAHHADALAIGCFDSDYLFLNLLNADEGVDLWASAGSAADAGLSGMRRSNFKAWSRKVKDAEAFRNVMKQPRDFAEDCLTELEPILNLPSVQSLGGGEEWPDGFRYCYAVLDAKESDEPPVLEWHCPPYYAPMEGKQTMISALNRGGASKGLGVVFAGKSVEREEVAVWEALIQVHDRRGEWEFHTVEIEAIQASNGQRMLYGELPKLPIPPKVNEKLPWMRKMDQEFQRCIVLKFVPEWLRAHGESELMTELSVHLIPLKNWSGQCGWVGHPMDDQYC